MKTTYLGVFSDKNTVYRKDLTSLLEIPYIEFIFKRELHHSYITPSNYICEYWSYTAINSDGSKRILKAGNFEIIDIGPDEGERNFIGRTIRISEDNGNKIYSYRSKSQYDFIIDELFPLMDALAVTDSWEIICQLEKLKQLETDIQTLKEKIGKRDQEITELKNEIKSLKQV
jgi:hypothetical protein